MPRRRSSSKGRQTAALTAPEQPVASPTPIVGPPTVNAPGTPARETPSPPKNGVLLPLIPSPALADAMGEVLAESQRRVVEAVVPAPARAPSAWVAAALGIWIVAAGLLLLRPAMVRGPVDQFWRPEPAVAEASLRYGVWLAHQRVAVFQRDKGRLPSFLAEAGVADSSLVLTVEGERRYTVEGRQGPLTLRLNSGMAADSFLGMSLVRLRAR